MSLMLTISLAWAKEERERHFSPEMFYKSRQSGYICGETVQTAAFLCGAAGGWPTLAPFARVGTSTVCRGGSDFIGPKHPMSAASKSTRQKSRRVEQPIHYYFEEISFKGGPATPAHSLLFRGDQNLKVGQPAHSRGNVNPGREKCAHPGGEEEP